MMNNAKRKPVKLNVEIVLKDVADRSSEMHLEKAQGSENFQSTQIPKARLQPPQPGFDFRARFERKGRGGQPVFVLYAFDHQSLSQKGKLDVKALGKLLKEKLSCGGTVHDDPVEEIILQFRDRDRLESVLAKLGLKMQLSGGC